MARAPVIRTVASTKDYARAAIVAWRFIYRGGLPTKEQIGVLYAQWIAETSGVHFWNWNIGNVKVTQAQIDAGVPWIDLAGTWEVIDGKDVVLPGGDPGRRFRAFASLDAAMAEHMALLKDRRFKSSWPFVEAGDPHGFAHALKAGPDGKQGTWDDYFTGSVAQYAANMVAAHKRWMSSSAFDDALAEVIASSERETEPEIRVNDFAIVHPRVPLDSPSLDEDDPPDDAA
jgi:hypothetical protein